MSGPNHEEALVISGGTVQGLIHENYGTVTQNFITQISDGIVDRGGRPVNSIKTRQRLRQRSVLLAKVKEYWIKGVLHKSLNQEYSLDIVFEKTSELVNRPFVEVDCIPNDLIQQDKTIDDAVGFYDQLGEGRTLAILGEPGAGKTITLLKLADSLIRDAETKDDALIPVVFNLASWSNSRSDLEIWLMSELQTKYGVSKSVGMDLLTNQDLILMLDGLDEVKGRDRDACASAINRFLLSHGQTEVVVCCRLSEYKSLTTYLQVREAILIHLLTDAQVEDFLTLAGEQLVALRMLLAEDEQLRDLAKTPLMLSIMCLAYNGKHVSELMASSNYEDRKKNLFDAYIKRMFAQQSIGKSSSYHPAFSASNTLKWLSWIANRMNEQSQAIFLIEGLQPLALKSNALLSLYSLVVVLLISLSSRLVPLLMMQFDVYEFMAWSSLMLTLMSLRIFSNRIYGYIASAWRVIRDRLDSSRLIRPLTSFIVDTANLYFSLYYRNLVDPAIIPVFAAKWSLGPALEFGRCWVLPVLKLLLVPLLLLPPSYFMMDFCLKSYTGPFYVCTAAIAIFAFAVLSVYVLSVFLLFVEYPAFILSGIQIKTRIQDSESPNQGMVNSLLSVPLLSLVGAAAGLPYVMLVYTLTVMHRHMPAVPALPNAERVLVLIVVNFAVGLGVFAAAPVIKHIVLRLMLFLKGWSPWNYAAFLDYASERLFLRKVGGGYIFVHRYLRDHFASMRLDCR